MQVLQNVYPVDIELYSLFKKLIQSLQKYKMKKSSWG